MSVPAFAIGVPASADEVDVAATLRSLDASARRARQPYEIVVAVNGPGEAGPAVAGVRAFAAAVGATLDERDVDDASAAAASGRTEVAGAAAGPWTSPGADRDAAVGREHAAVGREHDAEGREHDAVGRGHDAVDPGPSAVGRAPIVPVHRDRRAPPGVERAPDPARGGGPRVVLLRLRPRSKVAAWNAIRGATAAPVVVFADADVRVAPDAVALLVDRLAAAPALAAVAGREQATILPADGLIARVAALPYRFDFGNVPGRLYALRMRALSGAMPATVLHEDAYLTVALGRDRFVKEAGALVYLRPPTTWSDYLRQRVRNEVGKLQLSREFASLRRAHGFGRYPWRAFMGAIAPREYPLVLLSLAARGYARVRASWEVRGGFPTGWSVLASTKEWAPAAGAGLRSPGTTEADAGGRSPGTPPDAGPAPR